MDDMTKKITLNEDELKAMPPEEFRSLLMQAVKVEGTGVVRRADGTIKYAGDPDAEPIEEPE